MGDTDTPMVHDGYRQARERLAALGRELGEEQADTPVQALPGWTVKDAFSHLAGLATDVVNGNAPAGVPSDEFTGRQVAERSERRLPEVLDEWDETGPRFEQLLEGLGAQAPRNAAIDVWAHEVDIRSAVGAPVPADGGPAERLLDLAVRRGVGRGWGAEGAPPALRIVADGEEWVAGEGDPSGTLRTTHFELGRVMLGRRSPAQMAALDWEADDPQVWIRAIPVFGPAADDVVDSERSTG